MSLGQLHCGLAAVAPVCWLALMTVTASAAVEDSRQLREGIEIHIAILPYSRDMETTRTTNLISLVNVSLYFRRRTSGSK
jgi:hypothetical protein